MRLLFAITVGAHCAALWVFFAVTRRIRRKRALGVKAQLPRFVLHPQEFFEAGEYRTPRTMRLDQEIFKQKPRRPLSEVTFAAERPAVQSQTPEGQGQNQAAPVTIRPRSLERTPISPSAGFITLFGKTVPLNALDIRHGATTPSELTRGAVSLPIASDGFTNQRLPPRSERPSGLRSGTRDPYTHSLRGSGTQGPLPVRRPEHYPGRYPDL